MRSFVGGLLLLVLGVSAPAVVDAAPYAYIPSQGPNARLFVVDLATNTVATVTSLSNLAHLGVALNPAGTQVWVSNGDLSTANTVSVFDARSAQRVADVTVDLSPYGIAFAPDGSRAYVANHIGKDVAGPGSISVVDAKTLQVVARIAVDGQPQSVAVSPSGTRLYVANSLSFNVTVIDTQSNTIVAAIPIANTRPVVVNPTGTKVYFGSGGTGTISIVDSAANSVVGTISVSDRPEGMVFNSSGSRLYVADEGANSLVVFDTASNAVIGTAPTGALPTGVAFDPSGNRVVVTSQSGEVDIIDGTSLVRLGTVFLGASVSALGPFVGGPAALALPNALEVPATSLAVLCATMVLLLLVTLWEVWGKRRARTQEGAVSSR